MKRHVYRPDPSTWTPQRELALIRRFGHWEVVPSELRYAECRCGRRWSRHTAGELRRDAE